MMRVTPEDVLTGGLGLVVVLFVIVGVLAWITWMRRLGFWHFMGASRPRHGGSVGQVSLTRTGWL